MSFGGGRIGEAWYDLTVRDEGVMQGLDRAEGAFARAGQGAEDSMKRAQKATDDTGASAEKTGGLFSKFGEVGKGAIMGVGLAIGNLATGALLQAPAMAIQAIGAAVDLASNKAEAASKANVIFADSYGIIEAASKTATDTVGLSSGAYLTLAGNVGNLVTNFGITGDAAAQMSTDIVQLAADVGSFNNAPTAEVVEAIGAAFRGETEPARRFGIMLDQASIAAKAVEMGLASSTKEVSQAAKTQAAYALILEQTTNAQGDFARTSEGYANQQRINAAEQEEAFTKLGEVMLPIVQLVQGAFSDAMTGIINLIAGVAEGIGQWVEDNQGLFDSIGDIIGTLRDLYVNYLKVIWDFIDGPLLTALDLLGKAFGFVGEMIGVFIEGIGNAVNFLHDLHRAIDPNMAALEDMQTKFVEVGREAGLTEEQISEAWAIAAEAARNGSVRTVEDIENLVQGYKTTVVAADNMAANAEANAERAEITADRVRRATDGMAETWDETAERVAAATEAAGTAMTEGLANGVEDGMPEVARRVVSSIRVLADTVATGRFTEVRALGLMIPEEIADGITDNTSALIDAADHLIDVLKNRLSPEEQRLRMIGKKYTEAVAEGVASGDEDIIRASQGIAINAIKTIEDGANGKFTKRDAEAVGSYYASLLASGLTAGEARVALSTAGVSSTIIDKLETGSLKAGPIGTQYSGNLATGINRNIGVITSAVNAVENKLANANGDVGGPVGTSWVTSVANAIARGDYRIATAMRTAMKAGVGESPPKWGPLRFVDKWGENIGAAWVGGIQKAIGGSSILDTLRGPSLGSMGNRPLRVIHEIDLRNAPAGTTNAGVAALVNAGIDASGLHFGLRHAGGLRYREAF
jgi:hypothetical protein